uniref:SOUL heme-binding protein n=1 Tax=Phaeomonas parva TaxID=124430 RepID=A0A7S1XTX3_9STRA|mmetsp:Transcript_3894/g.11267  ORF Transcript_3894/g.11267 Transcript_3894/m.11267 type:complete len:387 (+) Transcript_3894:137-1297(+)
MRTVALLALAGAASALRSAPRPSARAISRGALRPRPSALGATVDSAEIEAVLEREYASFFDPMEEKYYEDNVEFVDPFISISGVPSYKNNVDMLAGRTALGAFLFQDAGIALHGIERPSMGKLRTRWTLRVQAKFIPWQPIARFTGVSDYTLSLGGKVVKQVDYWDSVNLAESDDGSEEYVEMSKGAALKDFFDQLMNKEKPPGVASQELPYELLRRTQEYEVRRYPALLAAETKYDTRPEGFDRLGSYCGGSNEKSQKVRPFAPSVISSDEAADEKVMRWPISFAAPGQPAPTGGAPPPGSVMPSVGIAPVPEVVVAVRRFDSAATQPAVKYHTQQLKEGLRKTGLAPAEDAEGRLLFAQYDAIFSLSKRNEVWVPLAEGHPWDA